MILQGRLIPISIRSSFSMTLGASHILSSWRLGSGKGMGASVSLVGMHILLYCNDIGGNAAALGFYSMQLILFVAAEVGDVPFDCAPGFSHVIFRDFWRCFTYMVPVLLTAIQLILCPSARRKNRT